MAKVKTALAYADHEITLSDYKSTMLMTTLIEARCNCGWFLRGFTTQHATALGKQHSDEPDVVYPSVIFDLK